MATLIPAQDVSSSPLAALGGRAKDCEEAGGQRVTLFNHMKRVWEKLTLHRQATIHSEADSPKEPALLDQNGNAINASSSYINGVVQAGNTSTVQAEPSSTAKTPA